MSINNNKCKRCGMGIIDISDLTVPPEKHELNTARTFAQIGKNIKFLRPSNIKGNHTPDFVMDGKMWEAKSPQSRNLRNIKDNLHDATKQSQNIVIDLQRIKMDEQECLAGIHHEAFMRKSIKRLIVITKTRDILTIK